MDAEPVVDEAPAVPAPALVVPQPPNPVHGVLQVCGITSVTSRNIFINTEGLDLIEAFGAMNGDSDVSEMAKRMAARSSTAAGRVVLGTMQIKRLQALVYWVKDHDKRGLDIDPEMWRLLK